MNLILKNKKVIVIQTLLMMALIITALARLQRQDVSHKPVQSNQAMVSPQPSPIADLKTT